MIEQLRTIAAMAFVGGVLLWVIRNPSETRALYPTQWIREAKLMKRGDWAKCLGMIAIFTAVLLYAIPVAGRLTMAATKVPLVDPATHPVYQAASLSLPLLMALVVLGVVFEEWLFRGVLLRKLVRFGRLRALALSSIVFGLFHLIDPGSYPFAFIPPTVAGIFLGAAYLKGGLKVAVPAHIGYNWIRLVLVFLL